MSSRAPRLHRRTHPDHLRHGYRYSGEGAPLTAPESVMPTEPDDTAREPARSDIDALRGPTMLEFGSSWCGFCRAARPHIVGALRKHPHVRHLKVEDGSSRPLGRSFAVKLWPTLVFLRDGMELARLIRPRDGRSIGEALDLITRAA